MKNYELDLRSGSIFKKIVAFSVPLILSSILQIFYNMMDIVVVGQFAGKESLAAVGATSSLVNLTINLFVGISQGVCVVAAKHYGAGDNDRISKTLHTAIAASVISGIAVGVYGVFCSKWMLNLTDTPSDIIDMSNIYMVTFFAGMPFFMLYNFGSSILRAIGDTKRPLYYLTVSGIINIVLNLVFVIVFKMGVFGVALATVIAEMISSILVIMCLIRTKGACHLDIKKIKLHKSELSDILKNGVPCGIQGAVFSISNVMIQSAINSFGSVVVAGNNAAQNIEAVIYNAMFAVAQSAMTFTSQNCGAGNFDRIKKGFWCCLLLVTAVGVFLGVPSYIFGKYLLKIFSTDPSIVAPGLTRMKYVCLVYFLCGIMDVAACTIRGIGYSILTMIISVTGICGFRIVWLLTVVKKYHTLDAIFISYPISWLIIFVLYCVILKVVLKKVEKSYFCKKSAII